MDLFVTQDEFLLVSSDCLHSIDILVAFDLYCDWQQDLSVVESSDTKQSADLLLAAEGFPSPGKLLVHQVTGKGIKRPRGHLGLSSETSSENTMARSLVS